jgi:hypothetical protein
MKSATRGVAIENGYRQWGKKSLINEEARAVAAII